MSQARVPYKYEYSEQQIRAIADSAVDAIISITSKSEIIFWNHAAERIFGYSKYEMIGKDLTIIMPVRYRLRHKRGLKRFCKTKKTNYIGHTVEQRALRKNGEEFPIELSVSTWTGAGQRNFTAIIRDISERKISEILSNSLNKANQAISSSLDINKIMQKIITESSSAIKSEGAVIFSYRDGEWKITHTCKMPKILLGSVFKCKDAKILDALHETKDVLVIDNAYKDNLINTELASKLGFKSLLIVPFLTKDEVVGAIAYSNHFKSTPFSQNEIDFAKKIATSISLAIENAKLYKQQKNISDTLQESILKMPTVIKGVDFGYIYRPATEMSRVGGDFCDLFELEHNKVAMLIGDVSGKGIEAASLTSLVKHTLKAFSYENLSPAQITKKTNKIVFEDSDSNTFVTLFLAILDTGNKTLTYCNSGHPKPLVLENKSKLEILPVSSGPLGIFKNADFQNGFFQLDKGAIFISYTDGLTEAKRDFELFGEDRLISFMKQVRNPNVKELPKMIFDEAYKFSGKMLSDDMVILTLSLK